MARTLPLLTLILLALPAAASADTQDLAFAASFGTMKAATPTSATFTYTGATGDNFSDSLLIRLDYGFSSAGVKAVSAVCTPAQAAQLACPAASNVGSGSITRLGKTTPFGLSLGVPSEAGDIATVFLNGMIDGRAVSVPARLSPSTTAGPQLSIANIRDLTPNTTNITGFSLTLAAQRTVVTKRRIAKHVGKGKHRHVIHVKRNVRKVYSLLTSPPICGSIWHVEMFGTLDFEATALNATVACQLTH